MHPTASPDPLTTMSPAPATASNPPAASRARRIVRSAPVRIIGGVLALGLTAALSFPAIKALVPTPAARFVWPYLVVTVLLALVYIGYVKLTERRALPELSLRGAAAELGAGVAIGAGAVCAVIAVLALTGSYRFVSFNPWSASIGAPLAEMLFVGVFEELLFRALIFRIVQRSLGNWPALLISSGIFALAHLGEFISPIGLLNTALAGLMFGAAWLVTGRLWLCLGIHAAWNYVLGSIFSIAVSGHPAKGCIIGSLSGADWVTGGIYGLEGSVATTLAMGALSLLLLRAARNKAGQGGIS